VVYRITKHDGKEYEIDNPASMPAPHEMESVAEPMATLNILVPAEFVGPCLELCEERRGIHKGMEFSSTGGRVAIKYEVPLSEIIMDFFDQLKSRTKGYASMEYEICGYQ
jgi:GTP-binding protein LepA